MANGVKMNFTNELIEWRGPSPFYFVAVPEPIGAEIKATANLVSYGWGVIPVTAQVGETNFTTSLIPRNSIYLVPIKNVVRLGESLEVGQPVSIELIVNL
jgi:hypothetical protein